LKKSIKNTTIADRVLFIVLIACSIAGMVIVQEAIPRGAYVNIEIDGSRAYTFPLDSDRIVPVPTPDGNMIIEIKDEKVRVSESDCPKKFCVSQGWIAKGAIICLPNKTVILVERDMPYSEKKLDAISG
jgi:hypothetical protein